MKILVTGAKGFLGKNLIAELKNRGYSDILEVTRETSIILFRKYVSECQFVFHLAGVNRPNDDKEFMDENYGSTSELLKLLKSYGNTSPILLTSSIQAEKNNAYGKSKKAAEDLLFAINKEDGAKVLVYRLSNIFGKWCKPNYNSVIATFCHNIARDLDIKIDDPKKELNLCYIDDVVNEFIKAMEGSPTIIGDYCNVPTSYSVTLGKVVELIRSFKESRIDLSVPDMSNEFSKKLYSTYLSYLPEDSFSYNLKMNCDHRGSFTEFIKTTDRGQVSINVSKPRVTKGNHWHHTKNEKFLVVSGTGVIRFRKIDCQEVIEYFVSGAKMEVIDIPTGYTHNIENLGDTDMVTIMWANEPFNSKEPDTYHLEV
ncbi:capsular polysaccharide biosynthesis protein CapF [Paenibacillus cremeus]|uniref:Capsular polysaccharide biosynthesis protein CapF n=1 Tax=Paenibacillus cremeus TaxID=2163881 RepID=A0A559K4Z2_9BACL|nr:capsular polysaccharide biosynthesis protein CapF [Paenibacillus cremeus]TVY07211.1 capsular polysaccharide biosynthesis protein CapF [Paenibacillus cremeus]